MKAAGLALLVFLVGCQTADKTPDTSGQAESAVDAALEKLSLKQLETAALVFRVAYDHALDSWQGPNDQTVAGCVIKGPQAEAGLAALRPWIDRRAVDEAKKLLDQPKSYRLPIDPEMCDRDCSCGMGLRVLEAAKLESQSHSKVKEWKKLRARLESKAELQTNERAEVCADEAAWVCSSEFLKAVKATVR